MKRPIPQPLSDIVSWGGGDAPVYKTIESLGFETTHILRTYRKTPFHTGRTEMIHKHKYNKDSTMVFYDYKDEINFFVNDDLVYTSESTWHCARNKSKIIREISLAKLI